MPPKKKKTNTSPASQAQPPSKPLAASGSGLDQRKSVELKPDSFVVCRLLPALKSWFPAATESNAHEFHESVRRNRLLTVPSVPWVRAYQAALGQGAILHIVYVAPFWLDFADAWRGGLSRAWWLAQQPDAIVLTCLDQVDRTPRHSWLQPLIDCNDGAKTLPRGTRWPPNLKVFCTFANDEYAFTVSDEIGDRLTNGCAKTLIQVAFPLPNSCASPISLRE